LHGGQSRPPGRGRVRETQRRHHAAAVPAGTIGCVGRVKRSATRRLAENGGLVVEGEKAYVAEPVQGGGQRRRVFEGVAHRRDAARRARADRGEGGGGR